MVQQYSIALQLVLSNYNPYLTKPYLIQRKCDQYWPSDGDAYYGPMHVKILNTYVTAHYTVRVFNLRQGPSRVSMVKKVNWKKSSAICYLVIDVVVISPPLTAKVWPVLAYRRRCQVWADLCEIDADCGPSPIHCESVQHMPLEGIYGEKGRHRTACAATAAALNLLLL